jgi:hypothetical protein
VAAAKTVVDVVAAAAAGAAGKQPLTHLNLGKQKSDRVRPEHTGMTTRSLSLRDFSFPVPFN